MPKLGEVKNFVTTFTFFGILSN